ncbi:MAG: hypothetical protein E3J35_04445 [Methanomassiliicoccales archaeon]|nr:MAG: hypothetical protein E3J35_04445 [Methanomassiliicoccales archaeon]
MRDESLNEELEEAEETEGPTKKRHVSRKKVLAVAISLIIISASIGVWFAFLRPWTIREIGEKVVDWTEAPYFDPSLAGRTVVVSGEVTHVIFFSTSLGPLTVFDLDDYGQIPLVEWKEPTVAIGDLISRQVRFLRGTYNEESVISSPQLFFPVVGNALVAYVGMSSSCIRGICLAERDDLFSDDTIIEVFLRDHEGFPLRLFNASLRKGVISGWDDYMDAVDGFPENPELDYLDSLEDSVGPQGRLVFVDSNSNGLLDDRDIFRVNLSRPSGDVSVLTYLLQINGSPRKGMGILRGASYIVMTSKGVFRIFSAPESESFPFWEGRIRILSETYTLPGVSTEIVVSDIWGWQVSIQEGGCAMWYHSFSLECSELADGEVASSNGISITFLDTNQDGYLNEDDMFVLAGLTNHTNFSFAVAVHNGSWIVVSWISGVGVYSGTLPVINWSPPLVLDSPINRTFMLRIERMYGLPGVYLGESYGRMVVDVKRNGSLILMSANLTQGFNYTLPNLNITFEDADGNGYANTGDFFLCTSSGPADYEIILGYVNDRHEEYNQPLISWPVSWQTN